jgi:GNAT superfamily N-acetyltransferase
MAGETDLNALLRTLNPALAEGSYVYVSDERLRDVARAWVREGEGECWVVPQGHADALGVTYDYVGAWITLRVHSSLAAVGLTAAVSTRLGEAGISCNIIAGLRHDHIIVPYDERARALALLTPSHHAPPVTLRVLSAEETVAAMPTIWSDYRESLLAAGETPEAAEANIARNRAAVMDGDTLNAANHLLAVHNETGEQVATLWLANQGATSGDDWFVYDVVVTESHRGQGYGRSTMLAAETFVREHGGVTLALNVFGFNARARQLYISLGYVEVARGMKKVLA